MICLLLSNLRTFRHRKSHSTLLHTNIQDLWHHFLQGKGSVTSPFIGKRGDQEHSSASWVAQ